MITTITIIFRYYINQSCRNARCYMIISANLAAMRGAILSIHAATTMASIIKADAADRYIIYYCANNVIHSIYASIVVPEPAV
jgi:hypothetical protein